MRMTRRRRRLVHPGCAMGKNVRCGQFIYLPPPTITDSSYLFRQLGLITPKNFLEVQLWLSSECKFYEYAAKLKKPDEFRWRCR